MSSTLSRPPFWLKVKKEYILDNLNEMFAYLRAYTYDSDNPNHGFDSTLDCLMDLASDLGKEIRKTPYCENLTLSIDYNTSVRILAATLLASQKKNVTPHHVIADLVNLILFSRKSLSEDNIRNLWRIVVDCLRGRKVESLGFTWNDIQSEEAFSFHVFVLKIVKMRFSTVETEYTYYIEGKGLLTLPPVGNITISPMNRMQYIRNSVKKLFSVNGFADVCVSANDTERLRTFEETYTYSNQMLNSMSHIIPSPEIPLKNYSPGEKLVVKIVYKYGKLVLAETCDSRYNTLKGKVYVWSYADRVDGDYLLDYLRKDDYLYVKLSEEGDFTFDMAETFEEYYRECAAELAAEDVHAIFNRMYPNPDNPIGSQWITDEGFRLGVDSTLYNKLDDDVRGAVDEAMETGVPLRIRMYSQRPDTTKESFYMYGTPVELSDVEGFDKSYADEVFIDRFLKYSEELASRRNGQVGSYKELESEDGVVLGHLMYSLTMTESTSSLERLQLIVATAMISYILGREIDYEYQLHSAKYLSRIVSFAQNEEVRLLQHNALLDSCADVMKREAIVSSLTKYRKPENTTVTTLHQKNEMLGESTEASIMALINASNDLRGIIGMSELNNIKQTITRRLGVEDEYEPIIDERTFYGVESISLEFKTSIVFPPGKSVADPDFQKWNILKAICGFLNSRSGGELLLGVNDSGYAVGVGDDIAELTKSGLIKVANIDNYRLYVQNIVDGAFRTYGGDVPPKEIVALTVSYSTETNPEGREILRIHITPYPYDAVKFMSDDHPAIFADSYLRRSGRTIQLTPELVKEVQKYKAQNSSSDISMMINLRDAIRSRNIVILKGYRSSSGIADRKVELYKIWENRGLAYGYDLDKKLPRIFKISRCEDIEITDKIWKQPHCPVDMEIDIFGMMLERDKCHEVEVLLTDYAKQLLIEENPDAGIYVKNNKDLSGTHYPYRLTCRVTSLQGISRFCMGLADEIKVVKGNELKSRLRTLAHHLIESDF